MLDFIGEFFGTVIDLRNIIIYVIAYLFSLWLLFSIWVYFDARKRYESQMVALAFFFIVLLLSFPGLLFYLIVRPEDEYIYEDEHHNMYHHASGGVNVPIVNFIGDDGVEMSLNLKISKQLLSNPNFNVDVNLNDKKGDFLVQKVSAQNNTHTTRKVEKADQDKESENFVNKILGGVSGFSKNVLGDVKSYMEDLESQEKEDNKSTKISERTKPKQKTKKSKDKKSTKKSEKKKNEKKKSSKSKKSKN